MTHWEVVIVKMPQNLKKKIVLLQSKSTVTQSYEDVTYSNWANDNVIYIF